MRRRAKRLRQAEERKLNRQGPVSFMKQLNINIHAWWVLMVKWVTARDDLHVRLDSDGRLTFDEGGEGAVLTLDLEHWHRALQTCHASIASWLPSQCYTTDSASFRDEEVMGIHA